MQFDVFSVIRSLSQQRMDQDEYSSFSLLGQGEEDQELEDEWTDVETRVSDRECVCVFTILLSLNSVLSVLRVVLATHQHSHTYQPRNN